MFKRAKKEEIKEATNQESTADSDALTVEYDKAKFSRRLMAALFDMVCFVAIGLVFYFYVLSNIVSYIPGYSENAITFANRKAESGLYTIEDDNSVPLITDSVRKDIASKKITEADANEYLNNQLIYFYTHPSFIEISGGLATYNHQKIPEGQSRGDYFVYDSMNNIVQDPTKTDTEMLSFYTKAVEPDALNYLYKDSVLINSSRVITLYSVLNIFIAVTVAALPIYLMFPLIFKTNRQTLGKKIFKLGVIASNGFRPTWLRTLARFAVFYFLELLLSVAFLIPLAISFSMAVFSKSGSCLHDYLTATYVIDISTENIYKDINEYLETHREVDKFSVMPTDIVYKDK